MRFAREQVHDLWQMDFMGHRALDQGRVHPLTVIDDHSRFALLLNACANQQQTTVKAQWTAVCCQVGLPQIILCDNGAPWGTAGMGGLTSREAWLLLLGIEPWHGRPHHPQTQGKVERLHGTIAAEVFAPHPTPFADLPSLQAAFDAFRMRYNHERPHEALTNAVPADHYRPSSRPFPDHLPAPSYDPDDVVRTVTVHGSISWQGRRFFVSRGLVGQPVAIRPTAQDGLWDIVFCQRAVATIDRTLPDEV